MVERNVKGSIELAVGDISFEEYIKKYVNEETLEGSDEIEITYPSSKKG